MTLKRSLPPAVIFDWDNTLIDTFPLLKAANNLARTTLGFPEWSDAEARANIRLAGRDAYPKIYGERWQEAERIFYDHVQKHHLESLAVMTGAFELLQGLHQMKVPMGILSNKRGGILRREIAHLGWGHFFKVAYGPDDVGDIGKPRPEGLVMALKAFQLNASLHAYAWYAGDTENDLRTARAAGVVPVYIENHRMSQASDIAALQPAFSFANCAECLDYLRSLVDSAPK
ncbi:MAG: HAD family hydrolase [Proteobacteria bacterium]|nr:HAD family hydrolase [Pseudomonadota bacterium]